MAPSGFFPSCQPTKTPQQSWGKNTTLDKHAQGWLGSHSSEMGPPVLSQLIAQFSPRGREAQGLVRAQPMAAPVPIKRLSRVQADIRRWMFIRVFNFERRHGSTLLYSMELVCMSLFIWAVKSSTHLPPKFFKIKHIPVRMQLPQGKATRGALVLCKVPVLLNRAISTVPWNMDWHLWLTWKFSVSEKIGSVILCAVKS